MMRIILFGFLGFGIASPTLAEVVIALKVLQPRQVIEADEVAVQDSDTRGALQEIDDVIGLEAKRGIYPGQPIYPSDVQEPAVVERNQPVQAIYQMNSLTITSEARALERGAPGEIIRIMNLTSRATITGEVQPNGSVKVLK